MANDELVDHVDDFPAPGIRTYVVLVTALGSERMAFRVDHDERGKPKIAVPGDRVWPPGSTVEIRQEEMRDGWSSF